MLFNACTDKTRQMQDVPAVPVEDVLTEIPDVIHSDTPNPTNTPDPTDRPRPSNTPVPTNTATSTMTFTPRPSATLTDIPEGVEVVKLKTSDGIDLVGYLHQPEVPLNENFVVVLAHGHTQSHREWRDFEKLLIENGIATMTFDFRGHGASGGSDQFATIGMDVQTVFDYVRQRGFERVVCIGSSMGGSACLAGAVGTDIDGLGVLSGTMNLPGTRLVSRADMEGFTMPKIFIYAENDIWWPDEVEEYEKTAEIAGEPKEIYIDPGISHASGILYDENGEEVISILLDFVKNLAK